MRERAQGFTLVELLLVIVVIAILATIGIPQFSKARDNAYVSAVTSDLKTLAAQQEIYQASHQIYADDVGKLTDLTISEGVNLFVNEANQGMGWAATGYHDALSTWTCGIYYGKASAANAGPATSPGTVICKE